MGQAKLNLSHNLTQLANYVSQLIAKESGNVLGEGQQSMVMSRLQKRMIDLGNLTPEKYYQYLKSNYDTEVSRLTSLLTTHHTFFFREFCHFEFILNNLSAIVETVKARGENKIRVLSAACSRGQEVYSLAMFFHHHLKSFPGMSFEIVGTDIDPESVKIANNGVYQYNEVKSVPQVYLTGNWQRGTGKISNYVKVKPHLKSNCQFGVMNLLNPEKHLGFQKFDIIFCRNVFIYFDFQSVKEIVAKLKRHVHKGGYFITGLSESLNNLDIEKQTLSPSVYSFDPKSVEEMVSKATSSDLPFKPPVQSVIPKPIRILSVDDSMSVLKLLKKIFEPDPDFEFVGTAKNGIEAQEFLKNNKVDAMTLDIHMPEMDGVEYLKKNYSKNHPHVVVVSSASREDTRYAQETLKNGACDFVEKPALNNLEERAEEIKNKIKMAFLNSQHVISKIDHSFKNSFEIKNTDKKLRSFFLSYSDLKKAQTCLAELRGDQPPTVLFFEGNNNYLEVIKNELTTTKHVVVYEVGVPLESNKVYICDFKLHFDKVFTHTKGMSKSLAVFGIASQKMAQNILNLENMQLLLEDIPDINKDLKEVASDLFPWTSFTHVGTEYLAKD